MEPMLTATLVATAISIVVNELTGNGFIGTAIKEGVLHNAKLKDAQQMKVVSQIRNLANQIANEIERKQAISPPATSAKLASSDYIRNIMYSKFRNEVYNIQREAEASAEKHSNLLNKLESGSAWGLINKTGQLDEEGENFDKKATQMHKAVDSMNKLNKVIDADRFMKEQTGKGINYAQLQKKQ